MLPSLRPALFLVLALLLVQLRVPTVRGNAAPQEAVAVATAEELADAVTGGAVHIVITAHLDLSSLPVFDWAGRPTTATDRDRVLFVDPGALQSLRVRLFAAHATGL